MAHLLKRFCPSDYSFLTEEAIGQAVFLDVREPPRRASDIVAVKAGKEVAIISAKWSLRHDRLKDLLEECYFFKGKRPGLAFLVVTNEYMPARLDKVVQNQSVDHVFHVKKDLLLRVSGEDPRLAPIRDISELFQLFA